MLATLGLLIGLGIGSKPHPVDPMRLYRELGRNDRARVSVWMNRSDPYTRGTRARVYVSAEQDAYLTVLRIDTDGRVRVLFPQDPWDDNWVPGGRTFEVEDRDGASAFRVDDPPGVGYVFVIASEDRFDYSSILTERDHWDYRLIADGQVRGDPYVAMTDLAERIVMQGGDYDYDLAEYDVERHYDYPRFVCYDCHAYAPYYAWNPYGHTCVRFRVVIYDDPYYYPYRYYGGRRVVVVRPRRPQPRYIFVDNDGRRDYVTRIQNRPRRENEGGSGGDDQIRPRRAEDVGGRGTVRTPGLPERRRPTRDEGSRPNEPRREEPRRQEPQSQQRETQPERRREPGSGGAGPEKRPPSQQPARRRDQTPPGMEPMKQPPREEARREEPRREQPKDQGSRRDEPRREEPRRQEPQPQPRAEPRREEPRRQDPPPQRAEPRRESGGSNRPSSGPELRRRRG